MEHLGPLQKPPATQFLSFSPPTPIDFSSLPSRPHFHDSSRRPNSLQYAPPRCPWDDKPPPNHEGIPAEASWLHSSWEQPTGSSGMDASVKNCVDDAATAALCRSWDFWDDSSILQHKRTAEEHHQPVGGNALVVEEDCGVLLCESRSSAKDGFAFPAVSGSPAIPFACKLGDAAAEDRGVGSASLSSRSEERNPIRGSKGLTAAGFQVKIEMDEGLLSLKESVGLDVRGALQANLENACNHHDITDKRGKGEQKAEEAKIAMMVKKEIEQQGDGQGVFSAARDASIGLKLGKRTYFEDGGAGVGGGGGGGVFSANLNANSSSNNTVGGGSKKQKASSPTGVVPRCQAEGCTTDLSNAKDYHRRHKVCDGHAKASKVKVGNLEQRFCQQCSRFHVLSEFDEGKRSCRRRLAGHNERRRKPQPEAVSLLSSGSFAFLPDDSKHSLSSAFLQHPFFIQHSAVAPSLDHHSPSLACQLRLPGSETQVLKLLRAAKEEPLSTGFPSLELHHFLQNNSTQLGGHSLALSQPPPGSAIRLGPEALSPASQPPSGIAISGRALSLLSSLGSPNNACSMSLNVSPHHPSPSLEQFFAENQAASSRQVMSSSDGQPCFIPVADKLVGMATPPHSLTNSRGESPNGLDGEQRGPSAMANFEGRAMFTMLQENGFNGLRSADSQHGRPILDLMQIPSPQSHHVSRPSSLPQVGFRYSELEGLRSYESMFGRQNIL